MLLIPDPEHRGHRPVHAAQDAEHQLLRARPGHRRVATAATRATSRKKAEDVPRRRTGIADTAYFGPEAEFFIFDSVRFDQNQYSGYYFLDSVEGVWNTGRERELDGSPNLGYKPRYKEGYFPVPPMDQFQDLRSEMMLDARAGRHRDRGAAPRGRHRRPGRDRHALRHAAARWPTS